MIRVSTRLPRFSRRVFVLFLSLVLAGGLASPARAQVPKEGTEILWDRYGIPHIFAPDHSSLFYAYGYAQMEAHATPMRIVAGPLLTDLTARPAHQLAAYRDAGGYDLATRIARDGNSAALCDTLEEAGLRGRAGGGFPTGHKWRLVARNAAPTKYFVCNANSGPGDAKVPYILGAAPHKVIEAVCVGALAVGASTAYLAVPAALTELHAMLGGALRELEQAGLIGNDAFGSGRGLDVRLVPLPSVYIAGEETALLEHIEGRPARPRGKPPLPTSRGLFGAPTVINNLETGLHAAWVLQHGAAAFRARGTEDAPGTLICSVGGDVARPGLYELPLGTSLSTVVHECGGGVRGGGPVKLVFPGGLGSAPISGDALDVALDYDALQDRGSDLGSGTILVVGAETPAVELAVELAGFFHESSCVKCQPCKDGTARTVTMLERLEHIDERSVDLASRSMPPPKRRVALRLLNVASTTVSGISYTDGSKGTRNRASMNVNRGRGAREENRLTMDNRQWTMDNRLSIVKSQWSIGLSKSKRRLGGASCKKKIWQRPTLPHGRPSSTIGAGGLNCRVRNGIGCNTSAMVTRS